MMRVYKAEAFLYKCLCKTERGLELLAEVIYAPFHWIGVVLEWIGNIVIAPIAFLLVALQWLQKKWYFNAQHRIEALKKEKAE